MLDIAKLDDLDIKWPVEFELEKGKPVEIELSFKFLPDDQIQALAIQGDESLIKGVVNDWSGIGSEGGEALAFNSDNLEKLLNFAMFRVQTVNAYYQAVAGFARKNSKRR